MKVLVTGGGGFLGTEICAQLVSKGHSVTSVSRSFYPHLEKLGVDSFQCDLSTEHNMDISEFDAIIHTAAKAGVWGKDDDFYQSNYIATKNILSAAKKAGIKYLVYTSSPSVVFGKDSIENADETISYPEKFYTSYAKYKAMAEKFVLEESGQDLCACSIRPHLIWGEGDPHIIPRLLSKARDGKLRIVGDGDNLVDIVHVKNAALAHVLALEAMAEGKDICGKAYFIGQERPVNLWDFINQILFRAGLEGVEDKISFKLAFGIGLIFELVFKALGIQKPEPPMTRFVALQFAKSHYFSHANAKKDLGYAPLVTIEEGLENLFKDKERKLELINKLNL